MKIVIVGAGEVGSYLCQVLSEKGHSVIAIEGSESVAAAIDEAQNIKVIHGNGSSAQVLKQAGVGDCHFFLAMTRDDRTNLVSCSLAKALGADTTISRIHDQTYTDNSYVNYQLQFGVDFMINPEALCAVELAKEIRSSGRVAVENFARGQVEVQRIKVTASLSRLIGKPLKDLNFDSNVRIGYVQRENHFEVPSGETVIEEGDWLTLFGTPEALFKIKPKFNPDSQASSTRVVLFGGDETAIALARLLSNPRFKVRILEKDPKLCLSLAERLPNITVINGDATSRRLLEEEQIGSSDYFVACTKDDENNIMTCLQVSKLGARHVQLVINKPDYEDLLSTLKNTLGVETVISPRVVTVNEILRYISTEPYIELATLADGTSKILEIHILPESKCNGKKIRDIALPRSAVMVALLHKYQVKVPAAEDTILSGDRVVMVAKEEYIQELLELLS